MGIAALWEKMKPAPRVAVPAGSKRSAEWFKELKAQIAQVAFAKSLQQFGREEENQ